MIITLSYLSLVRTRKALQRAYRSRNIDELERLDYEVQQHLEWAFNDDHADHAALATELGAIMTLYSQLSHATPFSAVLD